MNGVECWMNGIKCWIMWILSIRYRIEMMGE